MEDYPSKELIETQPDSEGILWLAAIEKVTRDRNKRNKGLAEPGGPEYSVEPVD